VLCECGEREATIHEVVITDGVKVERHLCEVCAAKAGMTQDAAVPLNDLISKFIMSPASKAEGQPASVCESCGMTYQDFRQHGLLGCQHCYTAFEERLSHVIERAHEWASHHVGKIPRRALAQSRGDAGERLEALLGSQEERASRLRELRKQLAGALDSEQYERAAALRDEIRRLTDAGGVA